MKPKFLLPSVPPIGQGKRGDKTRISILKYVFLYGFLNFAFFFFLCSVSMIRMLPLFISLFLYTSKFHSFFSSVCIYVYIFFYILIHLIVKSKSVIFMFLSTASLVSYINTFFLVCLFVYHFPLIFIVLF